MRYLSVISHPGTLWFAYVSKFDARYGNIYRCHLRNSLVTTTEISVAYTNITVNTPAPGKEFLSNYICISKIIIILYNFFMINCY